MRGLIILAIFSLAKANQNELDCTAQMDSFHRCLTSQLVTNEEKERSNATSALFDECMRTHGCVPFPDDSPRDDDGQHIKQCGRDITAFIRGKVVSCVHQRVTVDFKMAGVEPWPSLYILLYSYESVPLRGPLEGRCKHGDFDGMQKCYHNGLKNMIPGYTNDHDLVGGYLERGCSRRATCFNFLDKSCMQGYKSFVDALCECGYETHTLYGGKQLLLRTPSCAGLDQQQNVTFSKEVTGNVCDIEVPSLRYHPLDKVCSIAYQNVLMRAASENATKTNN